MDDSLEWDFKAQIDALKTNSTGEGSIKFTFEIPLQEAMQAGLAGALYCKGDLVQVHVKWLQGHLEQA